MSFGFNFRDTIPYATDGAGETYVLGAADSYPQTRNGITFGWESTSGLNTFDIDAGADRRIAGINYILNSGTQAVFRVDLPQAGDRIIRLALGASGGGAQTYQYLQLLDDVTVLATIDDSDGTAAAHLDDATGVDRAAAAWPADNLPITITTASTILRVKLGTPTAQSGSSLLAHLFVGDVISGATPVPVLMNSYRQRWS